MVTQVQQQQASPTAREDSVILDAVLCKERRAGGWGEEGYQEPPTRFLQELGIL